MLGKWNLDQSRYARERTDPAHYLSSTYYEHWLHGLELLLVENGLLSAQELKNGISAGTPNTSPATTDKVNAILATGAPTLLQSSAVNRFALDQTVVVKNQNPKSHTRLPSYVHGAVGRVVKLHGSHIYADAHASTGDKVPQHLYCVRFEGKSVWGNDAEPNSCVYVDLFEPYLLTLKEWSQTKSEFDQIQGE